jgi:hypothetical protein
MLPYAINPNMVLLPMREVWPETSDQKGASFLITLKRIKK